MLFEFTCNHENGIEIIKIKGDLVDRTQSIALVEHVDECIENKKAKFILSLGELKYLNSSGLNVIIGLFTKIRKTGGELVVSDVNKKVQELLLITKLNTLFTVTDNLENAISRILS